MIKHSVRNLARNTLKKEENEERKRKNICLSQNYVNTMEARNVLIMSTTLPGRPSTTPLSPEPHITHGQEGSGSQLISHGRNSLTRLRVSHWVRGSGDLTWHMGREDPRRGKPHPMKEVGNLRKRICLLPLPKLGLNHICSIRR